MSRNNSPTRRKERRAEAEARAERSNVIDCPCGNRHADDWTGCLHTEEPPETRLLRVIFGNGDQA